MKLIDLLSVIDDTCDVMIWAHNEDMTRDILVSSYNGKDSIDTKFNDCEVDFVSAYSDKGIDISIDHIVDEKDYV